MLLPLLACSGGPPSKDGAPPDDPVATLSAPGPHAVGYREEEVAWGEPARTLRLAVWFPTDAAAGDSVRYNGLLDAPGVLGGVEPAAGPLPVAVFSHGHLGYAENSSFLAEHLASHGWLVLAPDHTGNTTFDGGTRTTAIYWQRPLDVSAVLDHAEDHYDVTDEVVALGHSFGGYGVVALGGATYDEAWLADCLSGADASEACSTMDAPQADLFRAGFPDPRVRALVPMAPGDFRLYGAGVAGVSVPTMLMTGGLDPEEDEDGAAYWAALHHADDVHVSIPELGHQGFTAFAGTLGDPPEVMEPEDGWRVVRTYALAFALLHGRGDRAGGGILDGTLPVGDTEKLAFH